MASRQIEGRNIPACPACGFIAWRNPLVATMVIIETAAGLVLGRRSIDPGYGLWCLPGGFVNEDEHPEQAAARECEEEIAARVVITGLLGVYHITRGDGRGMLALAYGAELCPGEAPSAGSEMLEVSCFARDELPELAFSSHRTALEDFMRSSAPAGSGGPGLS
jgi:ADP-ribose pyrophosphatase YjhB (NUDIX family)